MSKLVIDIKDGYVILVAGGDGPPEYLKIDIDESALSSTNATGSAAPVGLFDLGNQRASELYQAADQIILSLPMRFSLIKPLSIDIQALDQFGDEFLQWEAKRQLPDELGQFRTGFHRLRESFDRKTCKYVFYAAARDFVDTLSNFVSGELKKAPLLESEAFGLFNIAYAATQGQGLVAAVSLEQDGAAVVIAHDGDFITGRFIPGDSPALGEEIMYYAIAHSADDIRAQLIVCGDMDYLDHLGSLSWADRMELPDSLGLSAILSGQDKGRFAVAAGLIDLGKKTK